MKKLAFLSVAALTLGLAACTSELEEAVPVKNYKDVIRASVDADATRTAIGTGNSVVWKAGDEISIFAGGGNCKYTLASGEDTNAGTFGGECSDTKTAALYPYTADATYDGTKISLTLADSYEYAAESNNNAPMAGLIAEDQQSTVAFKNAGALWAVTVKNVPAGYSKATLTADQKLAGKAEITFTEDVPALALVTDEGNKAEVSVTFTETEEAVSQMVFYFPLPLGEYTNLSFKMVKTDGSETSLKAVASLTVQRNKLYKTTVDMNEDEITKLKKACADGGTYSLCADVDITGQSLTVAAGKELTLDLNGKTITADNSATGHLLVRGTLTLKDSGTEGKIVSSKDYASGVGMGIIEVNGTSAKMTMESGTINTVRDDASNKGQFGVSVKDGATFEMKGGKIQAGWYAISGNGTDVTNSSTVNVTGGELVSTADYALYLPHNGNTTISGGTVNGAAGGITIQRGILNISGTARICSTDLGNTGSWGDGTGGLGNAALNVNAEYGETTVNITGGTFTADKAALDIATGSKNPINMNITGGTFSDASVTKYLSESADVNIKLNKDLEINSTILLNKDNSKVTLDLNGKTIKNSHEGDDAWTSQCDAITVKNGTLTIQGDGTIETCSMTGSPVYASGSGAKVIIKNGNYLSNGLKPNNGWSLIYADGGAKIDIEDGYYAVKGLDSEAKYQYVLNCKDGSGSVITVTGGHYNGINPSAHDHQEEIVIPSGYKVVEESAAYLGISGTWYKVEEATE